MAGNDIYVAGLGAVPMTYHGELKDVNFDVPENGKWNYHDEALTSLKCEPETDFFQIDDNVMIDGAYLPNGGYKLRMFFDSDSHVELFKNGQVELTYDAALRSWTMLGAKDAVHISGWNWDGLSRSYGAYGVDEWLFCSPNEALDLVTAALTCYATTNEAQDIGTAGPALIFAGSIKSTKEDTVSRAHLYTDRGDCSVDMPQKIEDSRFDMCTKHPCSY